MKEEAKEGQKRIMKMANRLLNSSQKFLKEGQFSISIPLTILAFEELAKVDFLRIRIRDNQEISFKDWNNLTFGKGAHFLKLKWTLKKKSKKLEKWTEEDIQSLNFVNQKLGLNVQYKNKNAIQKDVDLFLPLIPKFKVLKEDCLYVNWDKSIRKWTYFDRRFTENVKQLIANYLYLEARREFFIQKLAEDMPNYIFARFTDDDWSKLEKSKNRLEIIKIQNEISKVITGKLEIFKSAINQYKTSTEKQQK